MLRSFALTLIADATCAAVVAGTVFVLPNVALVLAMLFSGEPGGPMSALAAAAGGALAATAVAGWLFAGTLALDELRRALRAPWWTGSIAATLLPVVVVALASGTFAGKLTLRIACGAGAALLWAVYWQVYIMAYGVLDSTAEAVAQQGDAG